jgi:hypothetical protein
VSTLARISAPLAGALLATTLPFQPAGDADVPITARVDGTKLPPGKYDVVVKAHSPNGSSNKKYLRLRIVGRNG